MQIFFKFFKLSALLPIRIFFLGMMSCSTSQSKPPSQDKSSHHSSNFFYLGYGTLPVAQISENGLELFPKYLNDTKGSLLLLESFSKNGDPNAVALQLASDLLPGSYVYPLNFQKFSTHQLCSVSSELKEFFTGFLKLSEQRVLTGEELDSLKNQHSGFNCSVAKTLQCTLEFLESQPQFFNVTNGTNEKERRTSLAVAVSAGFDRCEKGQKNNVANFFSFGNYLFFNPTRLRSISIYEGNWKSYDNALVTTQPIAWLPVAPCKNKNDIGCYLSPMPIAACKGCENLISNREYTAFLFTREDVSESEIIAVNFRK